MQIVHSRLQSRDLTPTSRERAAVNILSWMRDEETGPRVAQQLQRETRDDLLRVINAGRGTVSLEEFRIANEFARWLFTSDQARRVLWLDPPQAKSAILRVIDRAAEKAGAEDDSDLVADETAASYPRLFEQVTHVAYEMRQFIKGQQMLGVRPGKAGAMLRQHVGDSLESWASDI